MTLYNQHGERQIDTFFRLSVRAMREAGHPLTSFQVGEKIIPSMVFSSRVMEAKNPSLAKLNVIKVLLSKHSGPNDMFTNLKGLGYYPTSYLPFNLASVPYWPPTKLTVERLHAEVALAFAQQSGGILAFTILVARMQMRGILLTPYTLGFLEDLLARPPYQQLETPGPRGAILYQLANPQPNAQALVA